MFKKSLKIDNSVGYKQSQADFEFTDHVLHVKEDMSFYLTSDGYLDQNGGAKGFPLAKEKIYGVQLETYHGETLQINKRYFRRTCKCKVMKYTNSDVMLIGLRI